MPDVTLTFLSSRGCMISSDLSLVKAYLRQNMDDDKLSFRYYTNNETVKNPLAKRGYIRAKHKFCENATNVICVDGSLTGGIRNLNEKGHRILLAAPYEYQFKNVLAVENGRRRKKSAAFRNFTHIIAGSPFSSKMLKDTYELEGISVSEGVCLPFTWDMNQTERQQEIRRQFEFYYPGMKGKKVLAVLTFGNFQEEEETPLVDFEMGQFLSRLGDEWFVITNDEEIVEKAAALNSEYCESFAYVDHILPNQNLLYFADALVTNRGRYATYFASRKKPFFCPIYKNNFFERYMKVHYPALYVEDWNDLQNRAFSETGFNDEQNRFCEEFCYFPIRSPFEEIKELL